MPALNLLPSGPDAVADLLGVGAAGGEDAAGGWGDSAGDFAFEDDAAAIFFYFGIG